MNVPSFNLADTLVQAALIQSVGSILAASIAAFCAALIGSQLSGRKKLKAALDEAVSDIHFLLGVEAEHCAKHQETHDESFKLRIRNTVREQGLSWSGRFTPGRVRSIIEGGL